MTDNQRLTSELRTRADQVGGHPISLDDVKRGATRMKWQQRAATGAVAAVVLAVGIPVGMSLSTDDASRGNDGTNIATEPPSPSPSFTPDADGRVQLTFDAPEGPAPRVGWMDGRTLRLPGAGTETLPKEYDDVVPYRGGLLGADTRSGTVDVLQEGNVVDSVEGTGFAVSADGTEIAWFEREPGGAGVVKRGIVSGEGEASVPVPDGSGVTGLSFAGSGRLVYELTDQSTGEQSVWYTDFDGGSKQIEGALGLGGSSLSAGTSVLTKVTDTGTCSAIYAFGGGESAGGFLERTCDFLLGEFSADGRYVIGWPAYGSGWGPGRVAVLDARTLRPVMQFEPELDYGVLDARWDGEDDSLVAIVHLDGRWQLLRLGVDGSIETASEPLDADSEAYPFALTSLL